VLQLFRFEITHGCNPLCCAAVEISAAALSIVRQRDTAQRSAAIAPRAEIFISEEIASVQTNRAVMSGYA
jgi:hypothetical protein